MIKINKVAPAIDCSINVMTDVLEYLEYVFTDSFLEGLCLCLFKVGRVVAPTFYH